MTEAQMRTDMETLMARLIQQSELWWLHDSKLRSCAAGRSTTRGHGRLAEVLQSLVNTRSGQDGHSNPQHAWVLRVPSPLKHSALGCDGRKQDHSHLGGETVFRGSQPSAVPCLGFVVQRKRLGDREEHRRSTMDSRSCAD